MHSSKPFEPSQHPVNTSNRDWKVPPPDKAWDDSNDYRPNDVRFVGGPFCGAPCPIDFGPVSPLVVNPPGQQAEMVEVRVQAVNLLGVDIASCWWQLPSHSCLIERLYGEPGPDGTADVIGWNYDWDTFETPTHPSEHHRYRWDFDRRCPVYVPLTGAEA